MHGEEAARRSGYRVGSVSSRGRSGVRDPWEGRKVPVNCGCACDGHDSRVGGRTRAFKLVSSAESQCCEW